MAKLNVSQYTTGLQSVIDQEGIECIGAYTVDRSQGDEFDFVVVCFGKSDPTAGIWCDDRRVNVMLSRTKSMLSSTSWPSLQELHLCTPSCSSSSPAADAQGMPILEVSYDFGSPTEFRLCLRECTPINLNGSDPLHHPAPLPRLTRRPATAPDAPFLSAHELAQSTAFRERVANAQAPPRRWCTWSQAEKQSVTMLIMAGVKFTQAWKLYPLPCLLFLSHAFGYRGAALLDMYIFLIDPICACVRFRYLEHCLIPLKDRAIITMFHKPTNPRSDKKSKPSAPASNSEQSEGKDAASPDMSTSSIPAEKSHHVINRFIQERA